jgi:hypothetical protein
MRDDRLRAAPADRSRKDPQIIAGVILPAPTRSIYAGARVKRREGNAESWVGLAGASEL